MAKYALIDSEMVSLPWMYVLEDMREAGVAFNVNEGHRTLARQQWFWDCFQCQCCNNGNLAARPSPFAPHIRTGRIDHAIDFSNDQAVFAWLQARGLSPARTVQGESWHVEVPAPALREYVREHPRTDVYDTLPKHVEVAVRRLLLHRKQALVEAKTGKGRKYRKAVRWRNWWRNRVEGMARRARKPGTKRVLRKVLDVN